MTGLEKMKSQILEEAHTCAEKILEDTRKEADEILAEAKKRAGAECSRIAQNAEGADGEKPSVTHRRVYIKQGK